MAAAAAIAIFAAAYVLIATEKIHRTAVALGGAGLMLLFHITDAEKAFFSTESGVDWNVIFLLLGMMVIVSVLRQTGVFEYVAIWAAKRARGRPYRLMVMLTVITAVASALLDNVTTVLLIAPVTFLVCERLALKVVPYLIAEVMASNIGGTATLVGDPPNIIIASRGGLSFNDFLVHLAPLVVVLMVVFCLLCRWLFRGAFVYDPKRAADVMTLQEKEAITDRRLLWQSLIILGLVVAAFVLHPVLHYEPSVVALLGAGILVAATKVTTEQALEEVEWPTLVFFAGLFVMVGGLVETGVIGDVSRAAADATEGRLGFATMLLLWASAGLSAIVDNIPYVATMSPIVADLVQQQPSGDGDVLWWALALGADLGGNATAIGASANVVVLGIAARNGTPISFWHFTRYGLIVTVITVALAAPYLWLRYL
ncbi:ArsB/NhaD family transporter [Actinomadura madurae]|uniref:ArsB/NhaD family transporter n=1 Tax=Actinomadura madurae TaxID=1993 RepID=UPI00202756E1|nr:ArsB/NhaD family transporter [Actinomadura madurae]MCP9951079.1 ArsB/NhaD family transporter [Actinomadura madurae]MCP9967862.1 ArsB/NhaD family transporter [Actinomadura madurae]MCP9980315.1 ArsB/NhaD family transporter [Actinomadura madurae]MCQ0008165.1 ArsB/NhaD family transporter [Actinomadura madurae]MCQ0016524.1 ArsB/NhaD family transporter [Actinomadura madurae]